MKDTVAFLTILATDSTVLKDRLNSLSRQDFEHLGSILTLSETVLKELRKQGYGL